MTTPTSKTASARPAQQATPTAMATLRADLYDCIQVNLALLAEREFAAPPLALGAVLGFAPRPVPGGLPTVEPRLDDHLDAARALLGLAIAERRDVPERPSVAMLLGGRLTVYVVADAFHLPWMPYHRRQHMEHSFLLEPGSSGATVLDAYHNDTAYGAARPGAWALRDDELAAALPDGAVAIALETAPSEPLPPGHRAPEPATVASYLDAYRTHGDRAAALQRLTLETWLLARARRLHAAHHEVVAGADPAVAEHLAGWAKLVEQTYIAHRRVERGRPEPAGPLDRLAELLTADQEVFGASGAGDAPHGRPGASPAAPDAAHDRGDDLRAVVAEEAAAVLGVPAAELLSGPELTSVGGFSSFRMVEIVERLEERLGVRFDADDLVPENLHDLDSLCRISQRVRKERS